jgi:hypothetical protein
MKISAAVAPEIAMVSENKTLKIEIPLRRRFPSVAKSNPKISTAGTVYKTNFKVTNMLLMYAGEVNSRW